MRGFCACFALCVFHAGADEETLRESAPRPCFYFCWEKGPNWFADSTAEFSLTCFRTLQPFVDDTVSAPSPNALGWTEKRSEPGIDEVARIGGRRLVEVLYSRSEVHEWNLPLVMLLMETGEGSDWFAPFFVARFDGFEGKVVSSEDVRIGYLATLSFSGTGAMRTHQLFDLSGDHPRFLAKVDSGRVVRNEFDSDEAFEKANGVFEQEKAILRGEVPGK